MEGKGWILAGALEEGDKLHLYSDEEALVKKVTWEVLKKKILVYNLEVEDFHTYYVSDQNVLVHNDCKIPKVNKAINSNLSHAIERSVERNVFANSELASEGLKKLSKRITKEGFPSNAILDTAHADRVLVPLGNNGMAVYQVAKNGTAKLKTMLIAK